MTGRPPANNRDTMPVRVFRLGAEPGDDLSSSTTAAERLAMVFDLSARMWRLTGRPTPDYRRAELPCRAIRPDE